MNRIERIIARGLHETFKSGVGQGIDFLKWLRTFGWMKQVLRKNRVEKIKLAIKTYSRAYNRLEKIQREEAEREDCLTPRGDQKTGPIGEFWVSLYLRHRYPKAKVLINPNVNSPYDMEMRRKGQKPVRIQVKTVSHWSDSRVLS